LHYNLGVDWQAEGESFMVHGAIEHHLQQWGKYSRWKKMTSIGAPRIRPWVTGVTYGILGPWAKGLTQIHYTGNFGIREWF
jgi:acyl-coenzyme A synthetase/AMP-(fatty) acid ligase